MPVIFNMREHTSFGFTASSFPFQSLYESLYPFFFKVLISIFCRKKADIREALRNHTK
jgi:hypothetical protein